MWIGRVNALGTALVAIALVLTFALPVEAQLFGRRNRDEAQQKREETKVMTGNADMQLGEYKGVKHAIGVRDFENDAGWGAQFNLPQNLGIMLESALLDTGRFVLVERDKLGAVIEEQALAQSGATAQAAGVAQTAQLRPAKYIATGALVEVEANESGVGGGLNISGFRIGGDHKSAQVTIIAKLVDTTTGEIVAKERIVGKAGRTGLKLGLSRGNFDGDIGGFMKTPAGEAIQDCISQAAYYFATQMEAIPVDGSVVMVSNGSVIINRGENHNFQVGTELVITERGEDLIDPETGEVLERAQGREIGRIRIDRVSEKVSYCSVLSGEANPARGATVTVASLPPAAKPAP